MAAFFADGSNRPRGLNYMNEMAELAYVYRLSKLPAEVISIIADYYAVPYAMGLDVGGNGEFSEHKISTVREMWCDGVCHYSVDINFNEEAPTTPHCDDSAYDLPITLRDSYLNRHMSECGVPMFTAYHYMPEKCLSIKEVMLFNADYQATVTFGMIKYDHGLWFGNRRLSAELHGVSVVDQISFKSYDVWVARSHDTACVIIAVGNDILYEHTFKYDWSRDSTAFSYESDDHEEYACTYMDSIRVIDSNHLSWVSQFPHVGGDRNVYDECKRCILHL